VRDPARTRQAAREQYVGVLQQALSCVSPAVWITAPPLRGEPGDLALTLSDDPTPLRTTSGARLYLSAGQHCRIVPDTQHPGLWRMQKEGYVYSVRVSPESSSECFAWHWHPGTRADFHLHVAALHPAVGDLSRFHVPAGPIAFSTVVRFLITDLDVRPLRANWIDILAVADLSPPTA
jgi:hypothetical protein